MNQETFIAQRKPTWDQLHSIVRRLESQGLKTIAEQELGLFGFLYRKTATDLSYAKARGFDPHLIEFLNALVAHAHAYVYAPPPAVWKSLGNFFFRDFPKLIRQRIRFVAVSFGLFFGAMLLSYLFVIEKPYTARSFVGDQWVDNVERAVLHKHVGPTENPGASASFVSSWLMTHNIKVAFAAFALGITFCLGTSYMLVYNGFMLGGLAGLFDHYGLGIPFWSLILPHGVLEIPAICIAGAGGLLLGYTLISPGDHSRLDALRLVGPEAVRMLMGTIPLFFMAGIIEASFTPLQIDPMGKIAFAVLVAAGFIFYLLL